MLQCKTNSKLKFQSQKYGPGETLQSNDPLQPPPLNFSKMNINNFQSYPPGSGPGNVQVSVAV